MSWNRYAPAIKRERTSLVLLPGLDGTGDLFRSLADVIPAGVTTRVVSYPTDQALSYGALLRLVEDELRFEREVVLIAESFSGPIAVRFAAAHGERVRAVVLCASFVVAPAPRWLAHFIRPLWFRVPPPAFAVRRWMVGRDTADSLVRAIKMAIRRFRPAVLAARLREVLAVDCSADLRRFRAPVLYLVAGRDALVSGSSVEVVRAARPDVAVRSVDGPHLLLQVSPEASWREISRFLSEQESPSDEATGETPR